MISRIWANRLAAGTKTWDQVPPSRKSTVKTILAEDVENGRNGMTREKYEAITGETFLG